MSTYQIQKAQIGADGSQVNMYPKNRDQDTIVTSYASSPTLYTALNSLYNKFNNYYTTADTVNKATSANYATSYSEIANAVTSANYATSAENTDSASKTKYDNNMRPITSYLSTADLSTTANSANTNGRVVTTQKDANKLYTDMINKFGNYYSTSDTVSKSSSADLATNTYKDSSNRMINTFYLHKTDVGTSAYTSTYTNTATHSLNARTATEAQYDSKNMILTNKLEYVKSGVLTLPRYEGTKGYKYVLDSTLTDTDAGYVILISDSIMTQASNSGIYLIIQNHKNDTRSIGLLKRRCCDEIGQNETDGLYILSGDSHFNGVTINYAIFKIDNSWKEGE